MINNCCYLLLDKGIRAIEADRSPRALKRSGNGSSRFFSLDFFRVSANTRTPTSLSDAENEGIKIRHETFELSTIPHYRSRLWTIHTLSAYYTAGKNRWDVSKSLGGLSHLLIFSLIFIHEPRIPAAAPRLPGQTMERFQTLAQTSLSDSLIWYNFIQSFPAHQLG